LNAALEAAVAVHAQAFYQAVRSDVAQLVKAAVQEVIEQERAKKL